MCIVYRVRYSLNFAGWKLRKTVAADLRTIYTAATVEEAQMRLAELDAKWGADYPSIVQSWRRNWPRLVPSLRLYRRNPQGDIHHQCHRVREHESA